MTEIIIDGFDQCYPPVCEEDIWVEITEWSCDSSKKFYVGWVIHDLYNRDFGALIVNDVLWSCDNENFDNTSSSNNTSNPYRTNFDISTCNGMIYYKVELKIQETTFKSDSKVFNVVDCEQSIEYLLQAHWCGDCFSSITLAPLYNLYMREEEVPYKPFYFDYDGFCWFINDIDNHIPDDPLPSGIIIDNVESESIYLDCEACCARLNCPDDWEDIPGDRIGTFYFEYQVYTCPDHIYVVKDFNAEVDCEGFTPPPEKIIYDTDCVSHWGHHYDDASGFPVTEPECITHMSDSWTKGFCVRVRESELPLGVVIDCACGGLPEGHPQEGKDCSTDWQVCVITPDGDRISWSGGDECLCAELPPCVKLTLSNFVDTCPCVNYSGPGDDSSYKWNANLSVLNGTHILPLYQDYSCWYRVEYPVYEFDLPARTDSYPRFNCVPPTSGHSYLYNVLSLHVMRSPEDWNQISVTVRIQRDIPGGSSVLAFVGTYTVPGNICVSPGSCNNNRLIALDACCYEQFNYLTEEGFAVVELCY